jgi:hypothetical protein
MKGLMYIDGPFHVESWEKYLSYRLAGLQANISAVELVYLQHHESTVFEEKGIFILWNAYKRNRCNITYAALRERRAQYVKFCNTEYHSPKDATERHRKVYYVLSQWKLQTVYTDFLIIRFSRSEIDLIPLPWDD